MADNITLNSGTGGATVRTYADSSGKEHPAAVAVYLTTVADGANVVQEVTPSHGLPVAQQGAWSVSLVDGANTALVDGSGYLTAHAIQSGTWNVGVDSIATVGAITDPVAASQSGTWNIGTVTTLTGITNPVAATQSGTWTIDSVAFVGAITDPVAAVQSGTWNVGLLVGQTLDAVTTVGSITDPVAVTQSGTWTFTLDTLNTIVNPVTVTQSTAANLKVLADINAGQSVAATQSGTWTSTVTQATASNLNATVSIAAAQTLANVTTVGTITNAVTVAQPTASSLNATAVLAAGTALVGKVSQAPDTGTIYSGTTALTPKFAKIAASSSGDNSVVALVAGKKIRVLRWSASASGVVNIKWRSNTTDLTGLYYMTTYASAGGAFCPVGIFETAAGEALQLNLSGAVPVGGVLSYIEV